MLSNNQLEWIIVAFLLLIVLPAFLKSIKTVVLNAYWHKQIAGDDMDSIEEYDYDINQEKPFYHE